MNGRAQRGAFRRLGRGGIDGFVGVPDSTLKSFIDEGLASDKVMITTREEEAVGIAAGMALAGGRPLVFMQNAGLASSIGAITSLVQMYGIPVIFLIGWRGYLRGDAPEHQKIGSIQPDLLGLVGLESRVITDKNWRRGCDWALDRIGAGRTCALVVRRTFLD